MLNFYRAQKTERILDRLSSLKTTPVYIPVGTTRLIQPLDVVVNAPIKVFISSSLTSIFTTMLITMFMVLFLPRKGEYSSPSGSERHGNCHSLPIDGSKDSEINIKDLDSYQVVTTTSSDSALMSLITPLVIVGVKFRLMPCFICIYLFLQYRCTCKRQCIIWVNRAGSLLEELFCFSYNFFFSLPEM